MPKFTTKIHYQKASDLRVLHNLAKLNAGPKGRGLAGETLLKKFVNDAVDAYARMMLEQLRKDAEGKAASKGTEDAGPDVAGTTEGVSTGEDAASPALADAETVPVEAAAQS